MSKFQSVEEFEREPTRHLLDESIREGRTIDQLKAQIAYERFLARMDPDSMTIKGGFAVKCHVPQSPHTKDIDMILREEQLPSDREKLPRAVREVINTQLDKTHVDDHFRFDTGESLGFSDLGPRDAACRMNVRAYIGDSQERFATFPLDVALSGEHPLPPQVVPSPNHLSWADIDTAHISAVPPEHLFADKLLIYVESQNENRVGDLAHMALLADGGLDMEKVSTALDIWPRSEA